MAKAMRLFSIGIAGNIGIQIKMMYTCLFGRENIIGSKYAPIFTSRNMSFSSKTIICSCLLSLDG